MRPSFLAVAASTLVPLPRCERPDPDLALVVTGARDGEVTLDPDRYSPGDRLQVVLTCRDGGHSRQGWRLVVFEGAAAGADVGSGTTDCGNGVPLPVAIVPTGTAPLEVCVALDAPAGPWRQPLDLGPRSVCAGLSYR